MEEKDAAVIDLGAPHLLVPQDQSHSKLNPVAPAFSPLTQTSWQSILWFMQVQLMNPLWPQPWQMLLIESLASSDA